jgi:acyl dehydratase
MPVEWSTVRVDDKLPTEAFGPVTRATLALFAGGSGDHNPLHIDIDYAREAGLPDVIAHGMLSMAYLGRYLERIASPGKIKSWSARFKAATCVGATVLCSATVTAIDAANGEISLLLIAETREGVRTIEGEEMLRGQTD